MTQASSSLFSASDVRNSSLEKPPGQNRFWPWQNEAGYQDTAGMCTKFCPKHNTVSSSGIKLHLKKNPY
jgi:hypothetical protein